jgi:methionyl-tRNA formyltransferase
VSFDDIGRDCMLAAAGAGADVVAVVTLPEDGPEPRPSGWCSFTDPASDLDAELIVTKDVNSLDTIHQLRQHAPDMVFVVGWSQLVREAFLEVAPEGIFGMHPTLLPKHRGRAPIPWAIISGLTKTGVTLFEIADPTADSGGIVGQVEVPIAPDETATTLYAKVSRAHLDLVRTYMPSLIDGTAGRVRQDESRASHWTRRSPRDGIIDWNSRASFLDAWIRGQTRPYPGAFTFLDDVKIVIWRALPLGTGDGEPAGTVLQAGSDGVHVRCGDGVLLLEEVEVEGLGTFHGSRIGEHVRPGSVLG